MEAGIIVAALEQEGIKATTAGEATAGFRAEAPGWVQVLVAEADLRRAQAILEDVRHNHSDEVDWSTVDVGEPERDPEPATGIGSLKLWRQIATAVIIIYLIWTMLALFTDIPARLLTPTN
jgi:hypothetical protein